MVPAAHFLFLLQSMPPAHGMAPPTFRASGPWTVPQKSVVLGDSKPSRTGAFFAYYVGIDG